MIKRPRVSGLLTLWVKKKIYHLDGFLYYLKYNYFEDTNQINMAGQWFKGINIKKESDSFMMV